MSSINNVSLQIYSRNVWQFIKLTFRDVGSMLSQPVCNEMPMTKVAWLLVANKRETVEDIWAVYSRKLRHNFLEIKRVEIFQKHVGIEVLVSPVGTVFEIIQEFL